MPILALNGVEMPAGPVWGKWQWPIVLTLSTQLAVNLPLSLTFCNNLFNLKWKRRKWCFKRPLDEIQKEQIEGAVIPHKPRAHLGPELELLLLRHGDDFHLSHVVQL